MGHWLLMCSVMTASRKETALNASHLNWGVFVPYLLRQEGNQPLLEMLSEVGYTEVLIYLVLPWQCFFSTHVQKENFRGSGVLLIKNKEFLALQMYIWCLSKRQALFLSAIMKFTSVFVNRARQESTHVRINILLWRHKQEEQPWKIAFKQLK